MGAVSTLPAADQFNLLILASSTYIRLDWSDRTRERDFLLRTKHLTDTYILLFINMTLCLMHVEILSLFIASEFKNSLLRTVCKLWCDIYDTENPNPVYRNVSNLRHNMINRIWNVYKIDDLLACGYITKPTKNTLISLSGKNDNGNYTLDLNTRQYKIREWSPTRNRMINDRSVEWITQICFTRCVPVSIVINNEIQLSDFTNGAYNDVTQTLSLLLPIDNDSSRPKIKVHADTNNFKVEIIGLIYCTNLETWIGEDYWQFVKCHSNCNKVFYDLFPDSIDAVCYCVKSFDNSIYQISKPRESRIELKSITV